LCFDRLLSAFRLWLSQDQYHVLFDSYRDNLCGKSFQSRLCLPMPINAVYTWVNGTHVALLKDSEVVQQRRNLKHLGKNASETTEEPKVRAKAECLLSHCIVAPMLALEPPLPANATLQDLPPLSPALAAAEELLQLCKPVHPSTAASVLILNSQVDTEKAYTDAFKEDKKLSVSRCYFTTEREAPGLIRMQTLAYLSGFPGSFKETEQLRAKLPSFVTNKMKQVNANQTSHSRDSMLAIWVHFTDLRDEQPSTLTFTPRDNFRVFNQPTMHVFGMWEETGVPGENPLFMYTAP
uniref:N-acetylglucosamine-1-phosphotransferase subunit alpha/beta regulatory domain-containing protein n=1 Tax=Hippocampus comes TaxID=109280 RepID=A0A3Q2XCU4_HIPCM